MNRLVLTALLAFAAAPAFANTLRMEVNGLVCAFCANGITKAFTAKPEVADVHVSLEDRLVAVALKPGQDLAHAAVKKALEDAGYTVVSLQRTDLTIEQIKAEVARGT